MKHFYCNDQVIKLLKEFDLSHRYTSHDFVFALEEVTEIVNYQMNIKIKVG